ncbi:MAG: hypothetical protein FWE61_10820, partial [Micrococcales bacterium]|nr:hypothetical protein [Micrococcales bacterium]
VRSDSYRPTLAYSQAVSQAYDAQALESLTLIKHGSGAAYEQAFVAAAEQARTYLSGQTTSRETTRVTSLDLLDVWLAAHEEIRDADNAGDWDRAVELALADGPGSAHEAFTMFVTSATHSADALRTDTTRGLDSARSTGNLVSVVAIVAGLAAAGLAWQGLARRREEYR